jgi:hypothetical protein
VIAALSALALTAAMASAVTNGCAPFCLPGRYFDYANPGLCLPEAPPPPPNTVVMQ